MIPLTEEPILMGGWQQAFSKHGDSPSGMVKALADDSTARSDLIGKAIEMSTVVEAWSLKHDLVGA